MRREEQLAPARPQRGVVGIFLDGLLEEPVGGAQVAARARRVGLDSRVRAAREQSEEARAGRWAVAAIGGSVAGDELGRTVERVLDREAERALRDAQRQQ